MRVTLIYNEGAGAETTISEQELVSMMRSAGHEPVFQPERHGKLAYSVPCDVVAVAGGDGTVGKVSRDLAGKGTPIAVLPMGTANNIAKTLGLKDIPLEDLIQGWSTAPRLKFDVGEVRGPWGQSLFLECLGLGLFANMMAWLDSTNNSVLEHLESAESKIAFVQKKLKEQLRIFPAHKRRILLDGQDHSGEYILIAIMNTKHFGPNLNLSPEADPGDGFLDVVFVAEEERAHLSDYLAGYLAGDRDPPNLTIRQCQSLQLGWDGFDIHLDDEVLPGDKSTSFGKPATLDVKVNPGALEYLIHR